MSFIKRRKQPHQYRSQSSNGEENQRQGTTKKGIQVSEGRAHSQGQSEAQETPLDIACSYCKARPGERCITARGRFRNGYYHSAREDAF